MMEATIDKDAVLLAAAAKSITFFVRRILGANPTKQQLSVLVAIDKGAKKIAIKSGHGCFGKGHPVLMYDGSVKPIEEVKVGDFVMGDDGRSPRIVLELKRGREEMYEFEFNSGDKHIYNASHLLVLVATQSHGKQKRGEIVVVKVSDYLKWSERKKRTHAILKSAVEFDEKELPIDPYLLGVWLGDGDTASGRLTLNSGDSDEILHEYMANISERKNNCVTCRVDDLQTSLRKLGLLGDKHIPKAYKTASIEQRLQLLAGLIDTDGHRDRYAFEITQKSEKLANDIVFVARSVGIHATIKKVKKKCTNTGAIGDYYRIWLTRNTHKIPCRVKRKRIERTGNEQRERLHFGIKRITPLGVGDYYGFVLNGNRRFLSGDFIVTHNTGKSALLSWIVIWALLFKDDCKVPMTAPSAAQLTDILIPEIRKWSQRLPERLAYKIEVFTDKVRNSENDNFAVARTARRENPEALQGFHCFASDSIDVLTKEGWKPIERITEKDLVLTMDEDFNAYFTKCKPLKFAYKGEMFRYRSRFINFDVTPNHKFLYRYRQCNKKGGKSVERWKWFVREVRDFHKGNKIEIPKFVHLKENKKISKVYVPEYRKRYFYKGGYFIDVDDFAEFMGWFLSEGWISKNGRVIGISQDIDVNQEKVERIVSLLERIGVNYTYDGNKQFNIYDVQFASFIRNFIDVKGCHNYYIPSIIFELPLGAREKFLEAFRLGDGYGDRFYCTSSKRLADDLQRLIILNGKYATINKNGTLIKGYDTGLKGSKRNTDYYRIREFDWRANKFSKIDTRKFEVYDYEGYVYCLEVPKTHLFYVRDRKTSTAFWTHNSTNLFFIIDEASGVPREVFEVAEGALTSDNAFAIMTGNPTRNEGYFYDAFHDNAWQWKRFTFNAEKSENVSRRAIEEYRRKYGEDSDVYRVRVLGEFPKESGDSVFSLFQLEEAINREEFDDSGAEIWGLDIGGNNTDSDASVLVKRKGAHFYEVKKWHGLDLEDLAKRLHAEYITANRKPVAIFADETGQGKSFPSMAQRRGLPVYGVNFGKIKDDMYFDNRTKLYYKLKELLPGAKLFRKEHEIVDEMLGDLMAQSYEILEDGRLKLLSKKKHVIPKLGRSPDVGDAMAIACEGEFYVFDERENDDEYDYDEPIYGIGGAPYG